MDTVCTLILFGHLSSHVMGSRQPSAYPSADCAHNLSPLFPEQFSVPLLLHIRKYWHPPHTVVVLSEFMWNAGAGPLHGGLSTVNSSDL